MCEESVDFCREHKGKRTLYSKGNVILRAHSGVDDDTLIVDESRDRVSRDALVRIDFVLSNLGWGNVTQQVD